MFQFHFSFSFSPWRRFALQPKISGKFVECIFLFYYLVYLVIALPSGSICLFIFYLSNSPRSQKVNLIQFASRSLRSESFYSTFLSLDAGQSSVEAVELNFFPLGVGVSTLALLHTSLCMLLVSSSVVEVRWSIMREKGQGIGKRYNEDSLYRDSF